jgi:hypothetical protein
VEDIVVAENAKEIMEQEDILLTEDPLLTQIDEFRVKALQLQQLLQDKEEKAQELQQLVSEREDKAEELQQILEERQERADGFTEAVERKIDSLVEGVNTKLDQVEDSIGRGLAESRESDVRRTGKLQESMNQMSEKVDSMSRVSDQLDIVRMDLSEKIHTESVQSYRNLSELVKNVDERLNKVSQLERQVKKLKGLSIGVLVLTLINLAGLIVAISAAFEFFYVGFNI